MKVKALQAVGRYKADDVIDVVADNGFDGTGLPKSRADELLLAGAVELVDSLQYKPTDDDLSDMTVAQLKHIATQQGIDFDNSIKKADLVALLDK